MVRNRYLRIERGRMLTEQGLSKNRCGQCGELKRGHVCRVPRTVISSNSLPQQQAARDHMVARARGLLDACATASAELTAPLTPGGSSDGGRTTLALGGAAPLTMQFAPGEGSDGGPTSTMSSPGPLSTHMSLGLSPLHNATRAAASPLARPLRSVHRTRWIFFCRRLRSTARAGRTPSRPRPSPPSLSIIRSSCRRYARAAHATPLSYRPPLCPAQLLSHTAFSPLSNILSGQILRAPRGAEREPDR